MEEMLEEFNGCTVFSKLDLRHGYHQIELDPDSRYITTFSSHRGLYRYTRLVQGTNSAFEEYQHIIGQLFKNTNRIRNISDDILIGGLDYQDHDKNLAQCLKITEDNNLTIKLEKCEFSKSEIEFYGFKRECMIESEKVESWGVSQNFWSSHGWKPSWIETH